jgi:tRNA modification GTPase
MSTDTIAAIATGNTAAGVGIVRVSGPAVPGIAAQLLGRAPRSRHAHYVRLRDCTGQPIDDGLLLYFPAPHSFTGEHVLELQAHGSPVVLELMLRHVFSLGARPARPGEFSERAFLNGKLDLAQAEAVADLIAAGSEAQARAALRSLQGVFSQRVDQLIQALTRLRVHVEAAIDFPEEDIDFLADPQIAALHAELVVSLDRLLTEAGRGVRLNRGLHALILGPPNAGKSSLLNLLAGSERAIVTDRAGTTRDLLQQRILLDGVELTVVDSAGLRRHSDDPIEQEGMRRARAEREQADLLLLVVPDGDADALAQLRRELDQRPCLWVHNKIDLSGAAAGRRADTDDGQHFGLCARSGEGLDALRQALRERAQGGTEPAAFSARTRHLDALARARQALLQAGECLQQRAGDLLAEELRSAQHTLGEITGAVDPDALLGRIFSEFCIGK